MKWRLTNQLTRHTAISGALILICLVGLNASTYGQLQFSEILFDTGSNEAAWEWLEVRNSSGAAIDLNGYILDDDDGNALIVSNISNVASGGMSLNTTVPANGVAVMYNAGALGFDELRFRDAWALGPTVSLIGVDNFPGLANGGDAIGLWSGTSTYNLDVADGDGDGDVEVVQFTNAGLNIDYGTGFPGGDNSASIYWNGTGSAVDGANWARTLFSDPGAVTSRQTLLNQIQINSILDFGNPGVVPTSASEANGLLVTEIMYNPDSSDSNWEWVEVKNNTGQAMDFSVSPLAMDDNSGTLDAANITTGTIADGEVALLIKDTISAQNFRDAWGAGLNVIQVANFPQLGNGGDSVALWDDFDDYLTDRTNGTFTNALTAVTYDDEGDWPADDGMASIYLADLNADATSGTNWRLSGVLDTNPMSRNATPAIDSEVDHEGGDVGSPGFFDNVIEVVDADFNDDSLFNCDDVDALVAEIVDVKNGGTIDLSFDLNGDETVNNADLNVWLSDAAGENGFTEPYLAGDATLNGSVDFEDFSELGNNWQQSAIGWCAADFNADGIVDFSDFSELGNNWQQSISMAAAHAQAVPEPTGLLMLLIGLLPLVARRR